MDTDEILDTRRVKPFLDLVAAGEHEHIMFRVAQHQFWVNVKGKGVDIWRGFRGDIPYRGAVKGRPRTKVKNIGWHFTNCFRESEDMRNKAVGILTHYGYHGVDAIPNADILDNAIKRMQNPFRLRWSKGKLIEDEFNIKPLPERILPVDPADWAPKFMRENPTLFPWYNLI
jgi:hypothetical protein